MSTGAHDGRAGDPRGRSVVAVKDVESGLVQLTVRGPWDQALRAETTRWLEKSLAERPSGLIVDLSGLDDPTAASLPTWLTARRTAACMEPAADLVICVPAGELAERLDRMGAGRFLPALSSLAEARKAVLDRRVLADRLLLRLEPSPGALAAARRLVTRACTDWAMPDLVDDATLIVSELVANAVEHAGTDLVVLVSRRRDGVHMAVCDRDARMPRTPQPDGFVHPRGRGLMLIECLTRRWGAMPTDTGMVVWATLRRRP